jgi:hypothetical protein
MEPNCMMARRWPTPRRRAIASSRSRTVAGLPTTAKPRSIMSRALRAFRSGGGDASIALKAPSCPAYST